MERDRRKEVHTVVALSNSEGQTAGGTRERQQRRALATTPQGAGRVGVTKYISYKGYINPQTSTAEQYAGTVVPDTYYYTVVI